MSPTISSAIDGFRRCGVAHPKAPTDYPAEFFTRAQLEILQAEPVLTVTFKEATAPPAVKLKVDEAIARIKAATTLDEINAVVEGDSRKTVLAAAEERLAELKPE